MEVMEKIDGGGRGKRREEKTRDDKTQDWRAFSCTIILPASNNTVHFALCTIAYWIKASCKLVYPNRYTYVEAILLYTRVYKVSTYYG